ncbi:hypothetical protein [Oleiharenicola lentus]|uniref:hypothetical protein n=1 Tax=Oleiharenicola lentus TaxID=2508720 RepID=UPI003F67AEFA
MSETPHFLHRLETIRGELVELAFTLDRRGDLSAADIAMMISAQLGELHSECSHFNQACPESTAPLVE